MILFFLFKKAEFVLFNFELDLLITKGKFDFNDNDKETIISIIEDSYL